MKNFEAWLNPQEVKLRAGEMDPQEARLVFELAAKVNEVVKNAKNAQELRTLGAIMGGMSRDLLKLGET